MRPDGPLQLQLEELERMLVTNPAIGAILDRTGGLELADWYLGAGAVAQTVWNAAHGFPPDQGIKDYDLVYFDGRDLSAEGECEVQSRAEKLLADLGVALDVKNQARVHLWYPERFGVPIEPFDSTEEAIATWPATASCIGVRRSPQGALVVCAPYGLRDLLALIVRPNKAVVPRHVFETKAARWAHQWPLLTVIGW